MYRVFHHGERQRGDTHRFAQTEDPEDFMSYVIFDLSSGEKIKIIVKISIRFNFSKESKLYLMK